MAEAERDAAAPLQKDVGGARPQTELGLTERRGLARGFKRHIAAVVGVVGSLEAHFIAVVADGDSRDGTVKGVQQGKAFKTCLGGLGRGAGVARELRVFLGRNVARGQRSKPWTVLVSADVAHQVVGPVGCQTGFQRCLQRGSASAQVAKEGYGCIVEVKVELRVKESAAHIAVDELRRPVGFANLKQASALCIGHALLEFARQRAPVELVHVLRRVVAESIKAIVLNPGHGRVGHGHHGGRERGIKGW